MNAEGLLRHFERISEAPDTVPRLRRFVLELAVRGRLVGQVAGDEVENVLTLVRSERSACGLCISIKWSRCLHRQVGIHCKRYRF